jgi:hypothetical protein
MLSDYEGRVCRNLNHVFIFHRISAMMQLLCKESADAFNLLKPSGYCMHHQCFHSKFYILLTEYLYVLYLCQKKNLIFAYTTISDLFL